MGGDLDWGQDGKKMEQESIRFNKMSMLIYSIAK